MVNGGRNYLRYPILVVLTLGLICQAKSTIFFDDFDQGSLDPAYWVATPKEGNGMVTVSNGVNDSPVSHSGRYAVIMGANVTSQHHLNYLDLHLDLSGYRDVALEFWVKDLVDETNLNDGLWISDDGETFTKILDFKPSQWPSEYGRFPPLDLDEMAKQAGVRLTSQFVIRWAQQGNRAFSEYRPHGIFIDDVHVFEPTRTYASLPFRDGFETGKLADHWAWAWPNSSRVGPASHLEVSQQDMEGFYALTLGNRYENPGNLNALDLHLNLEGRKNVFLKFMLRGGSQSHARENGLWLSDDGGETFVKGYDFWNGLWTDPNGYVQPIQIGELARLRGLELTENFVVRFQYFDIGSLEDFRWKGFFIDDVIVTDQPMTFVSPPFRDSFESSALGPPWVWRDPIKTAEHQTNRNNAIVKPTTDIRETLTARTGLRGLLLGHSVGDGTTSTTAIDLQLALANYENVKLQFYLMRFYSGSHSREGLWLSEDGGETFVLGERFNLMSYERFRWQKVEIDLSALAQERGLNLTDRFIVRFQAVDNGSLSTYQMEGLVIDDVLVTGDLIPDEKKLQASVPWLVNNSAFVSEVAIFNESYATAQINLAAIDRNGNRQTAELTLEGRSLTQFSAGDIFPGLNGYALHIFSNVESLHSSFLNFNTEASSGGNSPSQATALRSKDFSKRLLFGYVPGNQNSAVVIVAPFVDSGLTPVKLTLFDESGARQMTETIQLEGSRPFSMLVADLFPSLPANATVEAASVNGTLLAGTTFVFNHQGQPSMAAAIPLQR